MITNRHTHGRTDTQPENRKPSAVNRRRRHEKFLIQCVDQKNDDIDDDDDDDDDSNISRQKNYRSRMPILTILNKNSGKSRISTNFKTTNLSINEKY